MDIFEALLILEGLTVEQTMDMFLPKGLSEEQIISAIKHDPTSKIEGGKAGDYSRWILYKVQNGEQPTEQLTKNLEVFDKAKRKKNFEGKKNIMDYKTLKEFNSFMSDSNVEEKTEVELRTGIKPLFKGSKYTLYMPKTYEESKALRGDNAIWCTGDPRSDYHWKYYTQEEGEDLIIFYDNSTHEPVYQAGVERMTGAVEQFMDKRDISVDFESIVPEDIKNFIEQYYAERTESIRNRYVNAELPLKPFFNERGAILYQISNKNDAAAIDNAIGEPAGRSVEQIWDTFSGNGKRDLIMVIYESQVYWLVVTKYTGGVIKTLNIVAQPTKSLPAFIAVAIKDKYADVKLPLTPVFEDGEYAVYNIENQDDCDVVANFFDYPDYEHDILYGAKELKCNLLLVLSKSDRSKGYLVYVKSKSGRVYECVKADDYSEAQFDKTFPEDIKEFIRNLFAPEMPAIKPIYQDNWFYIFVPKTVEETKALNRFVFGPSDSYDYIDWVGDTLITNKDYEIQYYGKLSDGKLYDIEDDYYKDVNLNGDSPLKTAISNAGLLAEVPCYYVSSDGVLSVYVDVTTEAQIYATTGYPAEYFGYVPENGEKWIVITKWGERPSFLHAIDVNGQCVLEDEDDLNRSKLRDYREELESIGITQSSNVLILKKEDIKDATILSKEDAEKLPENIRKSYDSWWTKTPVPREEILGQTLESLGLGGFRTGRSENVEDYADEFVYICRPDGSFRPKFVEKSCDVRMVIILSDNNSANDLSIGEEVFAFGKKFIKISDKLLLEKQPTFNYQFSNGSNDYDNSNIKNYCHARLNNLDKYCWKK